MDSPHFCSCVYELSPVLATAGIPSVVTRIQTAVIIELKIFVKRLVAGNIAMHRADFVAVGINSPDQNDGIRLFLVYFSFRDNPSSSVENKIAENICVNDI